MQNLKYSAGAVSKGFWFQEFKKYIDELGKGKTEADIKKEQEENNLFLAPSPSYGQKMINEIARRARALPEDILEIFPGVNVSDQKLINLLGIMMTDRLFFEFMYEVYREALLMGTKKFEDRAVRIFFKNKSDQNHRVAAYTEETKDRLRAAYKTYLRESNLLIDKDEGAIYQRPLMDISLEDKLKDPSLYPYLAAITGVVL